MQSQSIRGLGHYLLLRGIVGVCRIHRPVAVVKTELQKLLPGVHSSFCPPIQLQGGDENNYKLNSTLHK